MTSLPYPPPWQDAATVCQHICVSEGTLDNWIKLKGFPPARLRGGKRMWKWSEVEAWLEGGTGIVPEGHGDDLNRRVFDVSKQAASR